MVDLNLYDLVDDSRAAYGEKPLPGEHPAGVDQRGEADFDIIETEFRKMETDGPKAVNWKLINTKTLEILTSRSKDLVLACRLTYGLYSEEGYKGLAVGVSILAGMSAQHWEGLFPALNRERARAGCLDWMAERLSGVTEANPPKSSQDKIFALVAYERLVELDSFLGERMTKFQPALGPLIRVLRPFAREARDELEAKAAAEKAAAEAELNGGLDNNQSSTDQTNTVNDAQAGAQRVTQDTQPAAPATVAAVQPTIALPAMDKISVTSGVDPAFDTLFSSALRVSGALREAAPHDPRIYLSSRFGAWSNIREAPSNRAGKSQIPPPQRSKLAELKALSDAGNQTGLMLAAESAFVTSPYWLTMQFTICRIMRQCGSDYDAAREVIGQSLASLLQRIPSLADLSFSDGMPFADAETKAWIVNEVLAGQGHGLSSGNTGDEHIGEATRLAQQGKVLEGLKYLSDFAACAPDGRRRFVSKLDIISFCISHDLIQPALSLIVSLDKMGADQRLDLWEPSLMARLLILTWQCYDHKNAARILGEESVRQGKLSVVERLGSLDIVQAAELLVRQ